MQGVIEGENCRVPHVSRPLRDVGEHTLSG